MSGPTSPHQSRLLEDSSEPLDLRDLCFSLKACPGSKESYVVPEMWKQKYGP